MYLNLSEELLFFKRILLKNPAAPQNGISALLRQAAVLPGRDSTVMKIKCKDT